MLSSCEPSKGGDSKSCLVWSTLVPRPHHCVSMTPVTPQNPAHLPPQRKRRLTRDQLMWSTGTGALASPSQSATMATVFLLLLFLGGAMALTCRDEAGHPVDWWILYKLPRQGTYRKPVPGPLGEGIAYAYLTSDLPDTQWTLSSLTIEDPESMPAKVTCLASP